MRLCLERELAHVVIFWGGCVDGGYKGGEIVRCVVGCVIRSVIMGGKVGNVDG